MLQHILLAMIVPALLLLGLPADFFAALLRRRWARRMEQLLGQPAVAWLLGNITLWVWHLPRLYNAALANEEIHIFQHLTFLVTGTIFWWPVLAPLKDERLAPIPAIGYLVAASASNTLLGILLTFIPAGFYPAYLHPEDALQLLPLLRGTLGLDAEADQQVGGALMWVLGGIIYFWAIMAMFIQWYNTPEAELPAPGGVVRESGGV
jgi:cytochrome c oxidase assembly factor CtaG